MTLENFLSECYVNDNDRLAIHTPTLEEFKSLIKELIKIIVDNHLEYKLFKGYLNENYFFPWSYYKNKTCIFNDGAIGSIDYELFKDHTYKLYKYNGLNNND